MALPAPLAIETAGLSCWPGLEVEWDGNWVRRAANGYTKRANSAQCFDPGDDDDIERRVADTRAWFAERGLPAVFRVNLLSGPRLVAALDAQGWTTEGESLLMACEINEVAADPRAQVLDVFDPAFLEAQRRLKGFDAVTVDDFRAILAALTVPAAGIVLRAEDGRPVSSALMAIAGGIVITGNVVTDAAERRKGHALGMMQTGLTWARGAGAHYAALNVEADNAAALRLYERLGYRRQYGYAYRVAP